MKLSLQDLLLPLMVLAFVGVAVTFLTPIFTTSNRWLVMVIVLFYLMARKKFTAVFKSRVAVIALVSCFWSVSTVMWSDQPYLSGMKGIALTLSTITCLAIGHRWALQNSPLKALDFLAPLAVCAIVAGVLGRFSRIPEVNAGRAALYQGLVNGPNMFGTMLAMCFPYLVWKLLQNWGTVKYRLFWIGIVVIALYYMVAAGSRGAIMVMLTTVGILILNMSLAKRLQIIIVSVAVVGNAALISPGTFEAMQERLIYKQASHDKGVLYTRRSVWQESYEQAKKGGFFGGGYGVTIGYAYRYTGGLTAVGFGREKGNSHLAIVEETGIVGLILYLATVFMLFWRLARSLMKWPRIAERHMLALVTGVLAGMVVHSVFEAWWVAPGSPEFIYFWTLAGLGLGLTKYRPARAHEQELPLGPHAPLHNQPLAGGAY